jgi:hypothetical protein
MSRYAKRTDDNHGEVIEEFRSALPEATVHDCSGAGRGFPDICIGVFKRNWLFEIKDPSKPESRRRLTTAQVGMHGNWQGQVAVAHSAAEILAHMARTLATEAE